VAFRQAALERLASPEQLDHLIQVTSPRGWLALAGVCGLVAAAIGWGILGRIPTVVAGQGILVRDGGVQTVAAPVAGQLTDLLVGRGDSVREEQPVARLLQVETGRAVVVAAADAGRVVDLGASRGDVLAAGAPLMSLELPSQPLEAILYVPPDKGARVRGGMAVQIAPASVRQEEYGLLLGRVTSVGEFPATYQRMRRILGSDDLARSLSAGGAPIEIHVELLPSPTSASSYEWTSPGGPPITLETGTACSVDVITGEQPPLSLVFAGRTT
jgi:hypothetical protein